MRSAVVYKRSFFIFLKGVLLLLVLVCCAASLRAQENPPHPIKVFVDPTQGMLFGAFYQSGLGGTVILGANGSRSSTGNIILANLGYSFSPALFQVDANRGALIQILNGPDATLSGSNGGHMSLHLGSSDVGSPYISTTVSPARTQIHIGGTLTVGNSASNPPGNYNGTFTVIFIQQ